VKGVKGQGAFGPSGSLTRSIGNFSCNPTVPDLVRATVKLTEYGIEGQGFRR
jgi:hypothetical protein